MIKKTFQNLESLIKPGRLIFKEDEPPKPDKADVPSGEKPKGAPEKPADKKHERAEVAASVASGLDKDSRFATLARSYFEKFDKGEPREVERLREKAESDNVTMIDLQGGWEWLGLTESQQDQKYAVMAQIYLKVEGDFLVVSKELDNTYKTKYGIGAGDLLPPSVTEIEVVDLNGNKRRGARQIKNDRVGYYDSNGGYIPIFGGYKIRPLDFIDEKSEPCKTATLQEKQNYLNNKEANDAFERAVTSTPREVLEYAGRNDFPISNLRSLRTADPEKLRSKVGRVDAEKIAVAKSDLEHTEMLLDHFGIRVDARSEINSGLYFVAFSGKCAEMLGWKPEHADRINDIQPNNTVRFILALQNGGSAHKFLGYEFTGGYDLDLTHLDTLNRLANQDQTELTDKLGKMKQPINSRQFIDTLFADPDVPEGMSMDEAVRYIQNHRERLGFLLGDEGQQVTLLDLVNLSRRVRPLRGLHYRFTALKDYKDYPYRQGEKMCAMTVSTMLGLGEDGSSFRGKVGSVSHLAAALMRSNLEQTGNAGIVFGYQNFRKGDVLVFRGVPKYADRKFAHVAVVTFNREIAVHDVNGRYVGTERYIGVQDDGADLQATIVPVNPRSHTWRHLARALKDPHSRSEYLQKYPEIAEMWEFRKSNPGNFVVRGNGGWWGDASQVRGGKVAFAVRTQTLVTPGAVA